jgi:hypothetical protein
MTSEDSRHSVTRRDVVKAGTRALLGCALGGLLPRQAAADLTAGVLPDEPLDIGREPQFLFDLYAVDSTWGLHEKQELVRRVAHTCRKHAANPVWPIDYSNPPSHFWAVRDEDGLFRIWYQLNQRIHFPQGRQKGQMPYRRYMGYAQSKDGIAWEHPNLDLFKSQDGVTVPRNCVMHRPESPRSMMGDTPQIVEIPERDRRGYRYHMLYLGTGGGGFNGIRLIGSKDGIHWDLNSDTLLADIASDHHNTVVYDPRRDEYVMYLRAKDIYLAPGQSKEPINAGQSRRGVARMTSKELWTKWASRPQTIISPDETDALTKYNYFYGMPVRRFAGIYWGFVQAFRWNDYMHPQLAWSRDGINFYRMPDRPKLIEYGPDGSWDDTMLLACPNWIEVGDEWWIYYNGWDGLHETPERNGNIGLAMIRKEGFISLRGPSGGGIVCTRSLRWPGGELAVNADARKGELRVRVSDTFRKPREGYNYDDCAPFTEDRVSHRVVWKGKPLDALKGQVIRLEFLLRHADLYTFRATA